MESPFLAGLSVAISGLIITFLSLGLFSVVISLLGRIFKEKEEVETIQESKGEETPVVLVADSIEEENAQIPVVIATAISYFRSKAQSSLGNSLEEGKSGWWAANRMNAHQHLGIRITRSSK